MNRRAMVKGALGGVLGLTLPPFARFALSQESPAVVPVSEGFVMLTGVGGNVLVRTASAGQVLVDKRRCRVHRCGAFAPAKAAGWRPCHNSVQHALAPGPGGRKPRLRAVGGDDRCSRKDPGASGDGLLPGRRGPLRESAARSGSPDRDLFTGDQTLPGDKRIDTATCSRPTPTAISTYSSETRTCWPRVMPSRR